MSITATVENGTIKLPPGVDWPDGMRVKIEPEELKPRSLAERYGAFAGMADDLPPDLARNLDHYVHGQPKREK